MKGTPASGPDWDLTMACCEPWDNSVPKETIVHRLGCVELPPVAWHSGLWILHGAPGRTPISNLFPTGSVEAHIQQALAADVRTAHIGVTRVVRQTCDDQPGDSRVPLLKGGGQAICPASPNVLPGWSSLHCSRNSVATGPCPRSNCHAVPRKVGPDLDAQRASSSWRVLQHRTPTTTTPLEGQGVPGSAPTTRHVKSTTLPTDPAHEQHGPAVCPRASLHTPVEASSILAAAVSASVP